MKNNKGITLIALVITIIVMLILVGVTISMAVNGGLFEKAGEAVRETNTKLQEEAQLAEGGVKVGDTWYDSIDDYLIASGNKAISKEKSYVGYYADVDGDGDADGVIYADLAVGNTKDGESYYDEGKYTIPKETDLTALKDYYISETEEANFYEEAKEVITATGAGGIKDRFYVMAFDDIDGPGEETYYEWVVALDSYRFTTETSEDFGKGRTNTKAMIKMWKETPEQEREADSVWGHIQSQVNEGWFVPSRAEWAAFIGELEWDRTSPTDCGLSTWYTSSSEAPSPDEEEPTCVYYVIFAEDYPIYGDTVFSSTPYRLSTSF